MLELSKQIKFDEKDLVQVIDTSALRHLTALIKQHPRKIEVICLAKYEDRFYLENLQYRAEQLKAYFVKQGVAAKKLTTKIGLDYPLKYEELKSSSIILLIK